ncbi:MAG: right-handed parallel beta-helix repeat-containing protein [Clostridia bacterium]|nr:right-handed parallel beta-helix repeat-containing protein [Clostridia bacterium]
MKTIYVSVNGNDEFNGTKKSPLKTLNKAVLLSRETGIKDIFILPGEYFGVSISLCKKDNNLKISANKGTVILYGGFPLSKWESVDGYLVSDFWQASKDNGHFQKKPFRLLKINEKLAKRSRLPQTGVFKHLCEWNQDCLPACYGHWDPKPTITQSRSIKYSEKDIEKSLDTDSAELLIYHEWSATLAGIIAKDETKNMFYLTNSTDMPAGAFADRNEMADKYVVFNTKEGLHDINQWYADFNKGLVWYKGNIDETINGVFPVFDNILSLSNAKNVIIDGLDIQMSNNDLINPGYGARHLSAAVDITSCENITIKNCNLSYVSAWGIGIKKCSSNILLQDCTFHDTGAGAVNFFENHDGENVTIERCQCFDIGKIYPGAVGIYGGGQKNLISHCEIHDAPYCAINEIGNYSVIEKNLIWNIKQQMQDGGAIYLIFENNIVLRDNVVLNNREDHVQAFSYYFDELCEDCIAKNNLSVNATVSSQNHIAYRCTNKNNIHIDNGLMKVRFVDCYDLKYYNNVFIADEILFYGPSKDRRYTLPDDLSDIVRKTVSKFQDATGITEISNNVIYSKLKPPAFRLQYSKEEPSVYMPKGNIYDDPGFNDIDNGDFSVTEDSNAYKAGYRGINFDDVGCTNRFHELFKKFWPLKPNYMYGWAEKKDQVDNT